MLKAVSLQKVHFDRRTFCYKLQIWWLHIFPLGGVEQDKGGDWGVDLPNVNLGGRVWWNPWTFSWIFFYLCLGQLWHPKKVHRIFRVKIIIVSLFEQIKIICFTWMCVFSFLQLKKTDVLYPESNVSMPDSYRPSKMYASAKSSVNVLVELHS